jgi:cytochrome c biogenesis protein CcmG/thiol:disulfide interchange protein DsbE
VVIVAIAVVTTVIVPGRAEIGSKAPPLAGETLDGATFDLASARGRPVVLNFWASWCIPCRDEFPLLAAKQAEHAGDGLAIVGALYQDDAASARAFVAEQGASWPTVLDPGGRFARAYRVAAPPQTYFIDREGIVRSIQIGELTDADFERQYARIAG